MQHACTVSTYLGSAYSRSGVDGSFRILASRTRSNSSVLTDNQKAGSDVRAQLRSAEGKARCDVGRPVRVAGEIQVWMKFK